MEQLRFEEKNGELYGYGKYIHYKIDTNRRVYNKLAKNNVFTFTNIQIGKGSKKQHKKAYLTILNNHLVTQNGLNQNEQGGGE